MKDYANFLFKKNHSFSTFISQLILPLFNQVFLDNFTPYPTYILLSVFPLFKHIFQMNIITTILIFLHKLKHELNITKHNR